MTPVVPKNLEQKAEEAIPKTLRDYLAPGNVLIFPAVAIVVWFLGIPWLQSFGLMVNYEVVWYLSITALSVFFAIWVFQHLSYS